jgi:hypothetical protein|tara:strand:+ start:279 stop:464 length:186 start_codon:yes stop_codon:yes gene_type:complete
MTIGLILSGLFSSFLHLKADRYIGIISSVDFINFIDFFMKIGLKCKIFLGTEIFVILFFPI